MPREAKPDVSRRPPYASNPAIGERGRQARLNILATARDLFGERGIEATTTGDIARRAGYSRAAFYQYFADRDDVVEAVAEWVFGDIVREVADDEPIGPDRRGRDLLRRWFEAYGAGFDRTGPFLMAFHVAAARNARLGIVARRANRRLGRSVQHRLHDTLLGKRQLSSVYNLIPHCCLASHEARAFLLPAFSDSAAQTPHVGTTFANMFHRELFGLRSGVNVRAARQFRPRSRARAAGNVDFASIEEPLTEATSSTQEAILVSAFHEFSERGYASVTVTDIGRRAGLSHGTVYRYFPSKQDLFVAVGDRYAIPYVKAFDHLGRLDLGAPDAAREFRLWFEDFRRTSAPVAALMRDWAVSLASVPELEMTTLTKLSNIQGALERFLASRPAGRARGESEVLFALLNAMTLAPESPATTKALSQMITRSLLMVGG